VGRLRKVSAKGLRSVGTSRALTVELKQAHDYISIVNGLLALILRSIHLFSPDSNDSLSLVLCSIFF